VSSSTAVVALSPENWRSRLAHWTRGEALLQHEDKILLLLTLIIGAVVGLVVAAFIFVTENLGARMYPAGGAAWRRVLIPTGGALITGYLLSRFFTNARGSGIPQTKAALFLREGFISLRTVLGKFGCCSASLASGIALGREGPSVQVGAGIASVLGRRLGLGPNRIRELIPVGAAAALAAAFNTPVAAVLFTLEEVMGDLHAPVLGSIVLGSATSWVTLHLLLGDEPLFHVPSYQLVSPIEFITYAVLGLAGGLVSVAFVKLLLAIRKYFLALPKWSEWLQPAAGGLAVGLMGWFVPDVLGVGYSHVSEALNGQMTLQVMALLVVLKLLGDNQLLRNRKRGRHLRPQLVYWRDARGRGWNSGASDFTGLHGRRGRVCIGGHGCAIRRHCARSADVSDHDLRNDARLFDHRAAHDCEPDQLLHLASPAKRADLRSAPAPRWDTSAVGSSLPATAVDRARRRRGPSTFTIENRPCGRCTEVSGCGSQRVPGD
jgi:H+/Cl- antiporter ClcA